MIPIILAAIGVVLAVMAIYTKEGIYAVLAGLCSIISNISMLLL
jgi:hypothetical protein